MPPKDSPYAAKMAESGASGSKRKRSTTDLSTSNAPDAHPDHVDPNRHTPKRSRSAVPQSAGDVSDDARVRSIRRKKGSRNLSNLNLRHAAQQQSMQDTPRESKFQEGSLTDKPSAQPPSLFTRFNRTDSANQDQIETLMADYHNSASEAELEEETARNSGLGSTNAHAREEPKSFFRFGRSLSKFYPFGLWNRIYDETHDKLLQQNRLEAERKARMKAEAEAKYAEMKQSGQFDATVVSAIHRSVETPTPHDSVVGLDSDRSAEHKRNISLGSELDQSQDYATDHENTEVPETEQKTLRAVSSRFSLHRPSLSNLKNGLKRVASDLNLGQFANRESSSSISPEKVDMVHPGFKSTRSRYDSKGRDTTRLSKRVSDLERKLQAAREELNQALDDASPVPRSGGKFHRFTPSTVRKTKFVPGGLPTLPSERLLFPEGNPSTADAGHDADNTNIEFAEYEDGAEDQETVRVSRERAIPPRASSLFKPVVANANAEAETVQATEKQAEETDVDDASYGDNELAEDEASDMDPNSITNFTKHAQSGTDHASLDAKLKALDASAKAARKQSRPKKRKSAVDPEDLSYRPGAEDDDDAEWDAASNGPKKKLKASGRSENNLRAKAAASPGTKRSPKSKLPRKVKNSPSAVDKLTVDLGLNDQRDEFPVEDSVLLKTPIEIQITEAEPHVLEPVYEEDEETTTVPLNDEPSKPTAKATPARYVRRTTARARSVSPHLPLESVESGIRSVLAAGDAAKDRRGRSSSPPPSSAAGRHITTVLEEESYIAVPGQNGVPSLPKGANGSFETIDELQTPDGTVEVIKSSKTAAVRQGAEGEKFEWPEDVF